MNCTDFVDRSSDYFDGSAPAGERALMDAHLYACDSCRRYKAVYEQGTSLLRSLPEPELGEDFEPRLRHRIFHVDDRRALIDNSGSATPALTVLGLAVLLTVVAWSPLLREEPPVVDLAPIVVDQVRQPEPASRSAGGYASAVAFSALDRGLWDDARLYEYTRLSKRYAREGGLRRIGFDHD
ncbi:MAG: zf-HC2 domain-containing protein [Gemmatimonadota bacterium]